MCKMRHPHVKLTWEFKMQCCSLQQAMLSCVYIELFLSTGDVVLCLREAVLFNRGSCVLMGLFFSTAALVFSWGCSFLPWFLRSHGAVLFNRRCRVAFTCSVIFNCVKLGLQVPSFSTVSSCFFSFCSLYPWPAAFSAAVLFNRGWFCFQVLFFSTVASLVFRFCSFQPWGPINVYFNYLIGTLTVVARLTTF